MTNIRKAKIKDIPKMLPLWLELMDFHEKLDAVYYKRNKKALQSCKIQIKKNIYGKNSTYLVAEEDNKIVGYIGGNIEKRPPGMQIQENGFVLGASVTKKYQNKGIGKKLEKELLRWFKTKKIKFVELRSHSKNKKTIIAWQKMGYKENLKLMIKKLK